MHLWILSRGSSQECIAWPVLILIIPWDLLLGQWLLGSMRSSYVSVPAELGCDKNGLFLGLLIAMRHQSLGPVCPCTVVVLLILNGLFFYFWFFFSFGTFYVGQTFWLLEALGAARTLIVIESLGNTNKWSELTLVFVPFSWVISRVCVHRARSTELSKCEDFPGTLVGRDSLLLKTASWSSVFTTGFVCGWKGSLVVTLYQECLGVREKALLVVEGRELGLWF